MCIRSSDYKYQELTSNYLKKKKYIVKDIVLHDHHLNNVKVLRKKIIFGGVDTQNWVYLKDSKERTKGQRKIIKHMFCFKSLTSIPFLRNYFFFSFNIHFPPK